jgi:hypothetical protein
MALDKRNYRQVVDTTVNLAQKAGVDEIVGRIVNNMKDENKVDVCSSLVFFSFTQNIGTGLFFKCRFCLYVCLSWNIQKKSPRLYASPRPGTKNLNVVEVWPRSSRGGQAQAYLQYIFTNTKHSLKVQMALE